MEEEGKTFRKCRRATSVRAGHGSEAEDVPPRPGRPRCWTEPRQGDRSPRASVPRNRTAPPAGARFLSGFSKQSRPARPEGRETLPTGANDAPGPRRRSAAPYRPSVQPRPQASGATAEPLQAFLPGSQDSRTQPRPRPSGASPSSQQRLKVPGAGGARGHRPGTPQPP